MLSAHNLHVFSDLEVFLHHRGGAALRARETSGECREELREWREELGEWRAERRVRRAERRQWRTQTMAPPSPPSCLIPWLRHTHSNLFTDPEDLTVEPSRSVICYLLSTQ